MSGQIHSLAIPTVGCSGHEFDAKSPVLFARAYVLEEPAVQEMDASLAGHGLSTKLFHIFARVPSPRKIVYHRTSISIMK